MMPGRNYSQATDVGLLRDNNEDAIWSDAKLGLWVVADGMGGHAAGEVASEITTRVISDSIRQGLRLKEAIDAAHQAVLNAALDGSGRYGMGSTVVALHSVGSRFEIAWVGDSRAYLWSDREKDGFSLQQLTIDHSYVQMLYQSGIISAAEMYGHPEKNVITQCLGSTELSELKVDVMEGSWHKHDRILLCSDGLSDAVSDQQICDIMHDAESVDLAVSNLIQAALANGGKDNISVIIVTAPGTGLVNRLRTISRWCQPNK